MKLTDEQFFASLRECAGIYARTSRAIETQHGIKFSRQAVRDRAEKKPEILEDIKQQNLDIAEEGLQSLMRSKDERVKSTNIQFYLKTQGKPRGYSEKTELDMTSKGEKLSSIDLSKLPTSVLEEMIRIAKEDEDNQQGG